MLVERMNFCLHLLFYLIWSSQQSCTKWTWSIYMKRMCLSWVYNQDIVRATARSLQLDTMPALTARRRVTRLRVPRFTHHPSTGAAGLFWWPTFTRPKELTAGVIILYVTRDILPSDPCRPWHGTRTPLFWLQTHKYIMTGSYTFPLYCFVQVQPSRCPRMSSLSKAL